MLKTAHRWCWILLAVLLLAACSGTRLTYTFLDRLIRWKVDEYVSLYTPQSTALNTRLRAFHDWHRREQLPVYVDFISQQMQVLERPAVSPQDFSAALDRAMQLWRDSLEQLLPAILTTLSTLDEDQMADVMARINKEEQKYREEHILDSVENRRAYRKKRMLERMHTWLGSVNAPQQQRIEQWLDELDYATDLRLRQGEMMRERLTGVLALRERPEAFQRAALPLLLHPEQLWTPAYRQYVAANRQATLRLLADMHGLLEAPQRQHLLNELDDYRTQFRKMKVNPQ
ncbi:MAG: DUF6279 family lipoprotein [Thiolinea sp.]